LVLLVQAFFFWAVPAPSLAQDAVMLGVVTNYEDLPLLGATLTATRLELLFCKTPEKTQNLLFKKNF
jgi:hypothetical protein